MIKFRNTLTNTLCTGVLNILSLIKYVLIKCQTLFLRKIENFQILSCEMQVEKKTPQEW